MAGDATFLVGKPVEITREEARIIADLSDQMRSLSASRRPGWFHAWCRAHSEAGRTVKRMIERSHATGEPERGSRR